VQQARKDSIARRPCCQRSKRQYLQVEQTRIEHRLRYANIQHDEMVGQLQGGVASGRPVENIAQAKIDALRAIIQKEMAFDRQCQPQARRSAQAHAPESVCAEDDTRENSRPSGETTLETSPWNPDRSSSRVDGNEIWCSASRQTRSRSTPLT
jgi:hypothetical protein